MPVWTFGQIEVCSAERRVLRAGVPQTIGARAFDLLLVLIESRGQVVSKDELRRRVWPGLVVEENNLTVQMSAVRKAIGAHAIETVPLRGYQFAAAVVDLRARTTLPIGNLPVSTTRLLGREAALEAVAGLLAESRLVTLTGPGGIGKSRLAVEVATAEGTRFPDGVWLIELASVVDAAAVGHAIAGGLGIAQRAGDSIEGSVTNALARRRLLLLLDNCEHVIGAVAGLALAIMTRCPHVGILATSREALMVAGEQIWPVPALSVAEGGASPAVELFLERAQGVDAAFAAADHIDAMTEICSRLDGVPLAIELAAARVRSMSPAQIRERLDQRFTLLTGGLRGAPRRHHTLARAVQWSYELLSPAEKTVLDRASVFAGGFTLAAAERVCAGADVPAREILDVLDSLVRKSLLNVTPAVDEARFGLLETIRQFSAERLIDRLETATIRRAHARWMADDSERHFALWRSPRQREAHVWLEREIGNLRIAFRWAVGHGDVDVAARVASNVGDMARHCLRDEPNAWAAEIVDAARAAGHRRLCVLLNWAASGACADGRYEDARRYGEEALALIGDPRFEPLVWACVDLAYVAIAAGDHDRAIAILAHGAAQPADQIDRYCAACHLTFLASLGRLEEARQCMDATLQSVSAAGVPCAIVVAFAGKADAFAAIEPAEALGAMTHAVRVARASRCRFLESYFTPRLAVMQAKHGDPADALSGLQSMRTAWSASTDVAVIAAQRSGLIVVLVRMSRFEEAAVLNGTLDDVTQGAALLVYLADALAELRNGMNADELARATQRGAKMTPAEADDYALACLRAAVADMRA